MLEQWAQLYCEIWKEPPWNENFWEPGKVKAEFRSEIAGGMHGEAFLALDGPKVIGFTHGYSVTCSQMQILVSGNRLLNFLFSKRKRVYYIDELGVAKEYRGRHISTMLTLSIIVAAQVHGHSCVTLRTDKQADVARHLYQKLGFKELSICDSKYPNRTYWVLQLDRSDNKGGIT